MKKILLSSALILSLSHANTTESDLDLSEELEASKVNALPASKGFTPDISLILDMSYTNVNFDRESEEGFTLNYAELALGASVDNYFDMKAIFHLSENDFEIEEAFISSTALPYHLKAKLGKFKSDFGYLNNKHHHVYNFADAPLIYQVFLGGEGLNEKGLQLQYVLPTSSYTMLGLEVLGGENEQSFGYKGFDDIVEDSTYPSLIVGYVKNSFDIGEGTLLSGLSFAKGKAKIDHFEDEHEPHAFDGDTTLYGVDLTYKKYFSANNALTFQNEYIYREMSGNEIFSQGEGYKYVGVEKKQGGFYSELIYQFDKNIRTGLRYSAITQNEITSNGIAEEIEDDIQVTSAMLEYNFSEFSRLRLQYNNNDSLYDEDGVRNNKQEFILQFNYAIGAHGAHAF